MFYHVKSLNYDSYVQLAVTLKKTLDFAHCGSRNQQLRINQLVRVTKTALFSVRYVKVGSEELNDVYSPSTVRAIKSRRIRCAGHVARMGVEERRIQSIRGET